MEWSSRYEHQKVSTVAFTLTDFMIGGYGIGNKVNFLDQIFSIMGPLTEAWCVCFFGTIVNVLESAVLLLGGRHYVRKCVFKFWYGRIYTLLSNYHKKCNVQVTNFLILLIQNERISFIIAMAISVKHILKYKNTVLFYFHRCFFRGNGGTANILRISGAQGYPECGTQRVRLSHYIICCF